MAKKITDEQKEMINELFLEYGIKKKVAEIMGISPASVARYIVPNYTPKKENKTYTFNGAIGNADKLSTILSITPLPAREVCRLCLLSEEEWEEIKKIQEEICI